MMSREAAGLMLAAQLVNGKIISEKQNRDTSSLHLELDITRHIIVRLRGCHRWDVRLRGAIVSTASFKPKNDCSAEELSPVGRF